MIITIPQTGQQALESIAGLQAYYQRWIDNGAERVSDDVSLKTLVIQCDWMMAATGRLTGLFIRPLNRTWPDALLVDIEHMADEYVTRPPTMMGAIYLIKRLCEVIGNQGVQIEALQERLVQRTGVRTSTTQT